MNQRKMLLCFPLLFSILFTSGCWDRRELNDRAIWLATGWDAAEDGKIELSGQIAVPVNMQSPTGGGSGAAGGVGTNKSYFTISEIGENVGEVMDKMQAVLSREAFFGQRRVVFFGEEFAKSGFKNKLDAHYRDPNTSIRTDLFVVKGGTAKKAIDLPGGFERTPAIAALKKHEQFGGRGDTSYLEMVIATNKDGISPTIPAVEFYKMNKTSKPVLRIAGLAIFNRDLELLGYIDAEEKMDFLWILEDLKKRTVSIKYKNGNASVRLQRLKCKISPNISGNPKKFTVRLNAEAELFENNTNLKIPNPKDITIIKKEFEQHLEKQVLQTIQKVQKEFGVDIFGFGEVIHRKHPYYWKTIKRDWNKQFASSNMTVKVNLKIEQTGLSGPSILITERESKE